MSLSQNSSISASDFNTLKSAIYTECARRLMVNPISYTQIGNASAGDSVAASLFVNLATPLRVLDAFTTKGLDTLYYTTSGSNEPTVTIVNPQGSPTKTIEALNSIVNEVKNHAAAGNTDCRNNCAGLCTNACTSCSGCTNSCTGCTGCTNACTNACKGCTGCTNACKGCTGCTNACKGCTGCTGGCQGCGSGCAGSCGGCGGNCSGNCWVSCGADYCTGSCTGGCSGGCIGSCSGGCSYSSR